MWSCLPRLCFRNYRNYRNYRNFAEAFRMHSAQMRRARRLYHAWRLLPDPIRADLAPLARDVKELALDLRGALDRDVAERELGLANDALATGLVELEARAA